MNPLRLNSLGEVQRLCKLVKSYPVEAFTPTTEEVKIFMTCEDATLQYEGFFIKTNNRDHYFVLVNQQFQLYKLLDSSFPIKTWEDKLLEVAMNQDRQEREIVDSFNKMD
jgi:hypothetical protein